MAQQLPLKFREQTRTVYERLRFKRMCKFHSQFISPGDLVFDIGANIGDYTAIYNSLKAKVICLEPQPYCINKLRERFNGNNNIILIEKGVSDSSRNRVLSIDKNNHATGTFSVKFKEKGPFSNRSWNTEISTPMTTLKNLITKFGQPDYCKIDVEGYEYQVLSTLEEPIKYISFEYSIALLDETERCMEFLTKIGHPFFNFSLGRKTTRLILKEWSDDFEYVISRINRTSNRLGGDIFVNFDI